MTDACRIATCTRALVLLSVGEHRAAVFCAWHANTWATSPEGVRAFVALREGRITQALLVAALSDFRTRVELEHQRDHDEQVIQARRR